jgi:hypothetical protein
VLVREGGAHRLRPRLGLVPPAFSPRVEVLEPALGEVDDAERNVLPFDDRAEQQIHAQQVEQPAAGRLSVDAHRLAGCSQRRRSASSSFAASISAAPAREGGCAVAAAATASVCNGGRGRERSAAASLSAAGAFKVDQESLKVEMRILKSGA